MAKCYLVGIDSSDASLKAARYALQQAEHAGAELKILHVLEWSPYSFLTQEELAERHQKRNEELHRAREAICEPALKALGETKVSVATEVRHGNVPEVLAQYADETGASEIFVGRHGGGQLAARVFGSVPNALIQISKIPVTIVP